LELIGYNSLHGKSSYLVLCDCGELFDFYIWSHRKRHKCGRLYVYGRTGIEFVDEKTGKHVTVNYHPDGIPRAVLGRTSDVREGS